MLSTDWDYMLNYLVPWDPPKNHSLAPQHPYIWKLSGKTGSGKTYSLIQLLMLGMIKFDHLYLFIDEIHNDKKWQFYLKFLDSLSELAHIPLYTIGGKVPDPDDFEYSHNRSSKVIVFDEDYIKNNNIHEDVNNLVCRGRQKGFSIIYMTRSYNSLDKLVYADWTYLSLFTHDHGAIRSIAMNTGLSVDKIQNYFRKAKSTASVSSKQVYESLIGRPKRDSKKHGFLFVDTRTSDFDLRFRSGFFDHVSSLLDKFSDENIDEEEK